MNKTVFVSMIVFLQVTPVGRTTEFSRTSVAAQSVQTFSASAEGFRSQFNSTIEAYRVGGETSGRQALNLFQLPGSEEWLTERLGPDPSGKFTERYNRLFLNFADSLEKTIGDVQRTRGATFLANVEPQKEEIPAPLIPGHKPSGMRAIKEPPLFLCHFKIQMNGRDQVSWGDEFTYEAGAFRFIGFGAQPFWAWQEGSEGAAPKNGSFVRQAVLVSSVLPVYPVGALGKEGVVVVHYLIDKTGRVKNATVVSGDPVFAKAAIDAVRQWLYKPATMGGMPVETDATATVQFRP
jgi:TonB family protein